MATDRQSTTLKMKDLEEATGVSREAIHFYLREGLLPEPKRPKHNVAHYSKEHVILIQAIKRFQRDRSLPLSDIKELLSKFDYAALPASDDLASFELAVQSHVNGILPGSDLALETVAENTGLSLQELNELAELGVISLKHEGGRSRLDFRDTGIVESWARLLERGFGEKPGYVANYLQPYAQAMQSIAKAEVDLFLDEFGAELTPEAAELAAEGIGITNDILAQMHTQAIMRALAARISVPPHGEEHI